MLLQFVDLDLFVLFILVVVKMVELVHLFGSSMRVVPNELFWLVEIFVFGEVLIRFMTVWEHCV